MENPFDTLASRAGFIRSVVAGGVGLAVLGSASEARASNRGDSADTEFRAALSIALIAEQLATTFYHTVLTSTQMMSDSQLGGSSTDPNHPGIPPNGNPANVRFLQAALDAETKHAAALIEGGASSPYTRFYFPSSTFTPVCKAGQLCSLGHSDDPTTFLGVLDVLESAFVAAYLSGIRAFISLGHPAAAELAANIVAVEAEHLFVGRVISEALPSNNRTMQAASFARISDAATALHPFLTGQAFPGGAPVSFPLPSQTQIAAVVGTAKTRIIARFL
jgi:hypothetical protein